MKEFLSNSWVVSIISGILVFFITNSVIMLQNRRKHKKQINDANTMVLNRLRGYVVDNGLPQNEVINAVKASTGREYNVKYNELLKTNEFCEELITDIIGNIYISNDNKVKYINNLQEYLSEKNNFKEDIQISKEIESNNTKKRKKTYNFKENIFSIVSAFFTFLAVFLSSLDTNDMSNFSIALITTIIFIAMFIMMIFIAPVIRNIFKSINK